MLAFGILLAALFVYGLIAARIAPWGVSGPMVFVAVGLSAVLFGASPGPLEAVAEPFAPASEIGLTFLEIALALTLFSDAARMNPRRLEQGVALPSRLLGIGMPLTIVLGSLTALLVFPGLAFWECVLLATVLAPTDAALGAAVVVDRAVPERIREGLGAEAGLNDGLAVPVLFLALALAANEEGVEGFHFVRFAAEQIGLGLLVGVLAGLVMGNLLTVGRRRGWLDTTFEGVGFVAAAIGTWLLAGAVGGNGFIAAFAGGLAVRSVPRSADVQARQFTEQIGRLLDVTAFFVFGLSAGELLSRAGPRHVIYAVLALTVLRMGPVAVALIRTGYRTATVAFVGWFGPRGLASIVLALVALSEQPALSGMRDVVTTMTVAVLLSVLLHGVTAPPFVRLYGRYVRNRAAPESEG